MLAIRMQRTGRKGHAQFRIIVQEARRTPTSGAIVYQLGHYNPHAKEVVLDKEKTGFYLEHGAQPSDSVARLLKREGVKLPSWVKLAADKSRPIKNVEKLRKNRPAEEVKAEETSPASEDVVATDEEATVEATVANKESSEAEPEEPTQEAVSPEPETPTEAASETTEEAVAEAQPESEKSEETSA